MKFVLSDESINKYGFRVLTLGIDITEFLRNPVMFYNHDRTLLPIGKWINIEKVDGKLIAEPEFDENDEFAMQIKSKVDQGILNATSIGFDVLAVSDDKKDLVKGQTRGTVTKSRMLEASIVDIPANGNAMKMSFSNGVTLSADAPEEFINNVLPKIKDMSKVALSLGLKPEATDEEILEAIEKINGNGDQVNAEQGIKVLVKLGVSKGFKKELIEKIAKADFDAALELIESKEDEPTGKQTELKDTGRLSELLKEVKGQNGEKKETETLSLKKLEKENPAAVKEMIRSKPELYQKLCLAEYGYEPTLSELKKLI